MDLKETGAMLEQIKMAYPSFMREFTPEKMTGAVKVWHRYLKNEDAHTVSAILDEYIETSPYPPSIADIKQKIKRMSLPSKEDLWRELVTAAKRSGGTGYAPAGEGKSRRIYYKDEEYKGLCEPLKRYVGSGDGLADFALKLKTDALRAKEVFNRRIEDILDEYKLEQMKEDIESRKAINYDGVKKIAEISESLTGKGNV